MESVVNKNRLSKWAAAFTFILVATFCGNGWGVDLDLRQEGQLEKVETIIYGATQKQLLGSIQLMADLDGDGFDDLIMGQPGSEGTQDVEECGMITILYGSALGLPTRLDLAEVNSATFPRSRRISGIDEEQWLSMGLAVGDIDNDGKPDLIAGAPLADEPNNKRTNGGAIYVFFNDGVLSTTTVDFTAAAAELVVYGAGSFDSVGLALHSGDVNADGIDDIVALAPWGNKYDDETLRDRIYVVYGRPQLRTVGNLDFKLGQWDLLFNDFPDSESVIINGEGVAFGDVDGNGISDFILGIPRCDKGHGDNTGRVAVFQGQARPSGTLMFAQVDADDTDPTTPDIVIIGEDGSDIAGSAVEFGNVVGDAKGDLIISAPSAYGAERRSGIVYCLAGPIASGTTIDLADGFPVGTALILGDDNYDLAGISLALTSLLPAATDPLRMDLAVGAFHARQSDEKKQSGVLYILRSSRGLVPVVNLEKEEEVDFRIFASSKNDGFGTGLTTGRIGSSSGVVSNVIFAGAWNGDGIDSTRKNSGEILMFREFPAGAFAKPRLNYLDLLLLSTQWAPDSAGSAADAEEGKVGATDLIDIFHRWHR
jgi:FG-GAP repeat